MLFYCPLENYPDRYSGQLSAPVTGWHEKHWQFADVPYIRIEAEPGTDKVENGVAYSPVRRLAQTSYQVQQIIGMRKLPTPEDVIFFDEFWSPGIEMIPFAYSMRGLPRPRMFATLWAQSVDIYDFTYSMRSWIRGFEKGIANILDGIFVATPYLGSLVHSVLNVPREKIHAVGHPFDSDEVRDRMIHPLERENKVVFSSRWDWEKRPDFFLEVVRRVLEVRQDIQFVVTTSQKELHGNISIEPLLDMMLKHPSNIVLKQNLSKQEYYAELCSAKIIFNCALQDWISYGLLEATVAGCYPVYPNFRSFKDVFYGLEEFTYPPNFAATAAKMICSILEPEYDKILWTATEIESRSWIYKRFDTTWLRMLHIMEVEHKYSDLFYPDKDEVWNDIDTFDRYEMNRNENQ